MAERAERTASPAGEKPVYGRWYRVSGYVVAVERWQRPWIGPVTRRHQCNLAHAQLPQAGGVAHGAPARQRYLPKLRARDSARIATDHGATSPIGPRHRHEHRRRMWQRLSCRNASLLRHRVGIRRRNGASSHRRHRDSHVEAARSEGLSGPHRLRPSNALRLDQALSKD